MIWMRRAAEGGCPCSGRPGGAGWTPPKRSSSRKNLTLAPLLPHAPELNPIKDVWAYLRADRLAIFFMDGWDDIVTQCCDAWNFFAGDPDRVRSITKRDHAKTVNG
jgi:hypothetical protein